MKIYTHNLGNDNGDPERRLHDFAERAKASCPDLLFLQAVSNGLGYTALNNLTNDLGPDYSMQYEAVYANRNAETGVAVISKLPIMSSTTLKYSDNGNQSQVVELRGKYGRIIGANVHHEAPLTQERIRQRKNSELSSYLQSEYNDSKHILAGTFNAWPKFPSIQSLQKAHGFQSAYKAVHKRHEATFPTMSISHLLEGKFMQTRDVQLSERLAFITNFMRSERYEIPATTVDYIFIRNMGRVANASLIRSWKDVPKGKLKAITARRQSPHAYAISDHFGIETEVTLG